MKPKEKHVKFNCGQYDFDGKPIVGITLEGMSVMPYWHDDLKCKAILSLLNTIDIKNFAEYGLEGLYFNFMTEIRELASDDLL